MKSKAGAAKTVLRQIFCTGSIGVPLKVDLRSGAGAW